MSITPLPTPPTRNDPATFSSRADSFLAALPTFATEANAQAVEVNDNTVSAGTSATNAASSASVALAAQQAAELAAGIVKWVSGDTYVEGAVVWSPLNYRNYRRKLAGSSTTDPSLDSATWAPLSDMVDLPIFSPAAAAAFAVSSSEDISAGCTYSTGLVSTKRVVASSAGFVAATSSTATSTPVATSTDGKTWVLRTFPSSAIWVVDMDGANGLAYVYGNTGTAISTDGGVTWAAATALPGGSFSLSSDCKPAAAGGRWLVLSGTSATAYLTTDHGTSWTTVTLPAAAINGVFTVNGKFWYWSSGTSAYWSDTGETGSWTLVTLPLTPSTYFIWINTDGKLYMAAGASQQVYRMDTHDTWTLINGVFSGNSNALAPVLINGVWAWFHATFGNAATRHAGGGILRKSTVSAIYGADGGAVSDGSRWITPCSNGVITIDGTNNPVAIFKR